MAINVKTDIFSQLKKFFLSDACLGLLLLGLFLLTNGYTYAWDDQHLEIPLLKKLIDPSLYPNDYYVTALKTHFISYLYPLLAKLISIARIPVAYFTLYLISRYIMLTFMFKLWKVISKEKLTSFLCVMMFLLIGRVEEFLYRTFSHQEFALGIIFIGLFAFYRNRFILASAILGIAANFHALYSGFPFAYLAAYLLWQHKKYGISEFLKSCAAFLLCATPILAWIIKDALSGQGGGSPASTEEWLSLYELACPQNHPFLTGYLSSIMKNIQTFYNATAPYLLLASAWIVNGIFNTTFQRDKKTQAVLATATAFVIAAFIFSYILPVKFFVNLNLVRNTQYMLFFLMGYTIILIIQQLKNGACVSACLSSLFLGIFRYSLSHALISIIAIGAINGISACTKNTERSFPKKFWIGFCLVILSGCVILAINLFLKAKYAQQTWINLLICESLIILACVLCQILKHNVKISRHIAIVAVLIPFAAMAISFTLYHKQRLQIEKTGGGFWQLQRNWIDMQNYVRKNTPTDAIILVPHDMEMGGFRIRSERTIIMSYRDCGVIGFDYEAGKEWQKRLNDIGGFQVIIQEPIEPALKNALLKYNADYIIFMNYIAPPSSEGLKRLYQNDIFSLFRIKR